MSEPTPIRAVIFDMDGVLTDSEPLINAAAIAMFKEKGLVVRPEDFQPFVGAGEDRYIGGVAEKYRFPLDLPEAKRRTYQIYLELVPKQLEAFPGAQELVRACRRAGLLVAVASSADAIKITANLLQVGLPPEIWDAVVTGEEVKDKKPAPDIFLVAAVKLGLKPGECVVVEDAVNGVQAAKAAGMRCVAVAQTFGAERLQAADLVRQRIVEVTVEDLAGRAAAAGSAEPSVPPVIGSVPPPPKASGAGWGFWATVGLTAAIAVASMFAQLIVVIVWVAASVISGRTPKGHELASNGLLLSLTTCASAPVAVGLSWLFAGLRPGTRRREYLGFCPVPVKAFIFWGAIMLVLGVLSDLLTKSLGRPVVSDFMVKMYETAGFLPLVWLTLVVVAPIAEETLFRGFLFAGIRRSRLGVPGAIVLPALAWSMIHLQYDAYGIATIFVAGLLLGWARWKTGSLYTVIFLHALMNLVATLQVALGVR